MALLRIAAWTMAAVAIGIGLSTWKVNGHTPVEHVMAFANSHPVHVPTPSLTSVSEKLQDAVDDVKQAVAKKDTPPVERHTAEDKENIARLISGKKAQKK